MTSNCCSHSYVCIMKVLVAQTSPINVIWQVPSHAVRLIKTPSLPRTSLLIFFFANSDQSVHVQLSTPALADEWSFGHEVCLSVLPNMVCSTFTSLSMQCTRISVLYCVVQLLSLAASNSETQRSFKYHIVTKPSKCCPDNALLKNGHGYCQSVCQWWRYERADNHANWFIL